MLDTVINTPHSWLHKGQTNRRCYFLKRREQDHHLESKYSTDDSILFATARVEVMRTCGVSADDKQSWYDYPVVTLGDVLVIKSYDADGVIGTTCPRAPTDVASIFRILTELFSIRSYNPSDQIITFRDVNERRINKTRKRRRLRRCICSSCSSSASGTGYYLLAIGYAHQLDAGPVRLGAASVMSSRHV